MDKENIKFIFSHLFSRDETKRRRAKNLLDLITDFDEIASFAVSRGLTSTNPKKREYVSDLIKSQFPSPEIELSLIYGLKNPVSAPYCTSLLEYFQTFK